MGGGEGRVVGESKTNKKKHVCKLNKAWTKILILRSVRRCVCMPDVLSKLGGELITYQDKQFHRPKTL